MRVLETKSWFPQTVHTSMRRCVIGLLALHRNFLSQIQTYKTSELDHEKRAPLTVYSSLEAAFQALVNNKAATFCHDSSTRVYFFFQDASNNSNDLFLLPHTNDVIIEPGPSAVQAVL